MRIFEALLAAEAEGYDVPLKRYSGPAMDGRDCLGVVCEDLEDLQGLLEEAVNAYLSEVLRCKDQDLPLPDRSFTSDLFAYRYDNYGHQIIVYWPHEEFPSDEEEE